MERLLEEEEECVPFYESDLEIYNRVMPLFHEDLPTYTIKPYTHYELSEAKEVV